MFMISGLGGRVHGPQNKLLWTWNLYNYSNEFQKIQSRVRGNLIWENLKILEIGHFDFLEDARAEKTEDSSYEFLKLLKMGSISNNKHEKEIW